MKWFCCQLGAREHYAVPRALHRSGALQGLFTDVWVRPGHPLGLFKRALRERYHPELAGVPVTCANASLLAFEALARIKGLSGWNRIMARNQFFQSQALRHLSYLRPPTSDLRPPTLFAYSYAALEILRWAKVRGWQTVLGQIDPGLPEERLVARLHRMNPLSADGWQPAPEEYWADWRAECELADHIVVNSDWSRQALAGEGIAEEKIHVIPLAYAEPAGAAEFQRTTPERFSTERPLRALFLGQINLRKGVGQLMEAVEIMRGAPVEFWFVGPEQIPLPENLRRNPQVSWHGPVARGAAADFYRRADVFLFPTLSDGFGLTQLEAQAWKLPVIASRCCGEVVEHERNGLLLDEPSATNIAAALQRLLAEPGLLKRLSAASGVDRRFSLESLASALIEKT